MVIHCLYVHHKRKWSRTEIDLARAFLIENLFAIFLFVCSFFVCLLCARPAVFERIPTKIHWNDFIGNKNVRARVERWTAFVSVRSFVWLFHWAVYEYIIGQHRRHFSFARKKSRALGKESWIKRAQSRSWVTLLHILKNFIFSLLFF